MLPLNDALSETFDQLSQGLSGILTSEQIKGEHHK
jgi:hypothetical protein